MQSTDESSKVKGTETMKWIDSHTHLYAEEFNEDREAAIAAAMECGLGRETLAGLAEAWRAAKARERAAMAALTGGIAWASTHDHHTDSKIVRETGLSTKSVRKALSR